MFKSHFLVSLQKISFSKKYKIQHFGATIRNREIGKSGVRHIKIIASKGVFKTAMAPPAVTSCYQLPLAGKEFSEKILFKTLDSAVVYLRTRPILERGGNESSKICKIK